MQNEMMRMNRAVKKEKILFRKGALPGGRWEIGHRNTI
jgi:hypothetical protein